MKPAISLLFLALAFKSAAQINIICSKLTDRSLNYFYIGVDNPLAVIGNKITANYIVTISGGGAVITKESANNYIVRATTVADDCSVVIIGKNGKAILKKEFKVRVIAEPVATLSGIKDTTVSRNRILLNPFLSIVIPNCYYQHNMRVVSFTATFTNNGDSIPTIANGNLLSNDQLNLVKEANPGCKIYFHDIRGHGPDDRTRKFTPFWIKIE